MKHSRMRLTVSLLSIAGICGLLWFGVGSRPATDDLSIEFAGFTQHETNLCATLDITSKVPDSIDFLVAMEQMGMNGCAAKAKVEKLFDSPQ